jgi:hypothetical protein
VSRAEAISKLQALSDERAAKVFAMIEDLAELEALEGAVRLEEGRNAQPGVRVAAAGASKHGRELSMRAGRWGLYIDVEGFSDLYDDDRPRALSALRELTDVLYKIGRSDFLRHRGRTFIHQLGDGFAVVSESDEETAATPLAVCLVVMRHLIDNGVATKAGISKGGFEDIFGCLPPGVQEAAESDRYVPLGESAGGGLMTITPVMGSALTRAHKLLARRRGAVLLLDSAAFCGLPLGTITRARSPTVVDWVHSDCPLSQELCQSSGLKYLDPSAVAERLLSYLEAHDKALSQGWLASTRDAAGL